MQHAQPRHDYHERSDCLRRPGSQPGLCPVVGGRESVWRVCTNQFLDWGDAAAPMEYELDLSITLLRTREKNLDNKPARWLDHRTIVIGIGLAVWSERRSRSFDDRRLLRQPGWKSLCSLARIERHCQQLSKDFHSVALAVHNSRTGCQHAKSA